MSQLHINSLPDLCFRIIFSKLPVEDLLQVVKVCQQWASLAPAAGIQRRTLTINIGEGDSAKENYLRPEQQKFVIPYSAQLNPKETESDNNDSLQYEWFDSDSAVALTKLMPNITSLTIRVDKVPSRRSLGLNSWSILVHQFISLLEEWSATLQTLKLYLHFANTTNNEAETDASSQNEELSQELLHLLCMINQLEALTCLTIHSSHAIQCPLHGEQGVGDGQSDNPIIIRDDSDSPDDQQNQKHIDLPIISKLFKLKLSIPNFHCLTDSLVKYGSTNQRLRSLVICGTEQYNLANISFQEYGESLTAKVTYLPNGYFSRPTQPGLTGLRDFCAKFGKLQFLELIVIQPGFTMGHFVRAILPMSQLICLKLATATANENVLIRNLNFEMPSVRVLILHNVKKLDPAFDQIHFERYFPNLELLEYKDDYVNDVNGMSEGDRTIYLQTLLKPWQYCSNLHTCYIGNRREGATLTEIQKFQELWH